MNSLALIDFNNDGKNEVVYYFSYSFLRAIFIAKVFYPNNYRLFAVVIMERSKFTKMIHCFPNFLKTLALFKYRESVGNIGNISNGKSFQNKSSVFNKYECTHIFSHG